MAARALLVYAVCRRTPGRVPLAGIAGEPLGVVEAGGLAAIVGELARAPKVTVPAMRRFDGVLRELAAALPAVLPARFGTCMESVEELAFVLRSRDASLRAALRDVRGRVQMTLRGVAPGGAREAQVVGGAARRGPGAAHLQALALAAARERRAPALAPVLAAVARWVRAERVERSGDVASVYHLIPRGAVQHYVRAAQRAAQAEGARVVLTGPFPAYAFGNW